MYDDNQIKTEATINGVTVSAIGWQWQYYQVSTTVTPMGANSLVGGVVLSFMRISVDENPSPVP
jgi:hypothetical protein